MEIDLKEDFSIHVDGYSYSLPTYSVVDGKGIERLKGEQMITFVRGSKDESDDVGKVDGTLHEHLLSVMIHDLKLKNDLVPSREGAITITKLQEALHWLRERQIDRKKRQVLGTYQK